MHVLDLFAGIGGLAVGAKRHLARCGLSPRTVCYVEREITAARILVSRIEAGDLDPAPIWGDVSTFDGASWRGKVDLITAGYPCQPFSSAGKRLAQSDPRWVWPHVARVIREVRPGLVFLENVRGHLYRGRGFGDVLGSLAGFGYDAVWTVLQANEVGVPQRRPRLFVLAHAPGSGLTVSQEARETGVGSLHQPWRHHYDGVQEGGTYLNSRRMDIGAQPLVLRGPDGLPGRVDRVRCLGNAVVPDQAAEALRRLILIASQEQSQPMSQSTS